MSASKSVKLLDEFTPQECAKYLSGAGYAPLSASQFAPIQSAPKMLFCNGLFGVNPFRAASAAT